MPDVSTLLEDIETTRRTAVISSYRSFLDEKSPGPALAAQKFYKIIDGPIYDKFSIKLADCRTRSWFVRNEETGKVRIAAKQCRLRWCFHCSEARQQFITQAVSEWWNKARAPKLLTVTLKHNDLPLPEQIDFLYKSFAKFRNRKFLKSKIRGGVWFFQVTWNAKTKQWHPHLHALIDSEYLDHAELMVLWKKITKTSNIVHIRAVLDPDKTLSHNARYAARPAALIKLPEEKWPELFESFDGRRICGSWGTAKEISLRPGKPEDSAKWKSIGGFATVYNQIHSSEDAKAIWKAFMTGKPLGPYIDMNEIDRFIDDIELCEHPPPKKPADWKLW